MYRESLEQYFDCPIPINYDEENVSCIVTNFIYRYYNDRYNKALEYFNVFKNIKNSIFVYIEMFHSMKVQLTNENKKILVDYIESYTKSNTYLFLAYVEFYTLFVNTFNMVPVLYTEIHLQKYIYIVNLCKTYSYDYEHIFQYVLKYHLFDNEHIKIAMAIANKSIDHIQSIYELVFQLTHEKLHLLNITYKLFSSDTLISYLFILLETVYTSDYIMYFELFDDHMLVFNRKLDVICMQWQRFIFDKKIYNIITKKAAFYTFVKYKYCYNTIIKVLLLLDLYPINNPEEQLKMLKDISDILTKYKYNKQIIIYDALTHNGIINISKNIYSFKLWLHLFAYDIKNE